MIFQFNFSKTITNQFFSVLLFQKFPNEINEGPNIVKRYFETYFLRDNGHLLYSDIFFYVLKIMFKKNRNLIFVKIFVFDI